MNINKSIIALSLIASAVSMTAHAQQNTQPLTRAEVVADLQAYKKSGLQALSVSEQGPDTNSATYKAALARYNTMTDNKQALSTSRLTREQVKADLSAWKDAGLPPVAIGNQTPDVHSAQYQAQLATYQRQAAATNVASEQPLTRQEVNADLAAWNAAGLPAFTQGDHTADTTSAAYKAAFARYEQLRDANS